MTEGFQYETELIDHMSGPAAHAGEGLESLAGHARHAEESLKGLSGILKGVGEKFSVFGKEGGAGFLSGLVPEIAVAELAVEGVKKIGEGVFEVAEKTFDIAEEGVKFSLEMSEFKENATAAYTVVEGTAEEGERAFAMIDKLGRDIHMPAQRAHDLAQSLMVQGLENVQEVTGAIQAVGDLQRVGMDRGAQRLQTTLERSLATGKLELGKRGLAGTGLNIEAIAKELPGPLAQVKEQLKHGQIDAEVGIAAVERAFSKSKLHEIAAQKFTIGDLATDIKNDVRGMFQDVDASPLINSLHDLDWAFGQATGSSGGLKSIVVDAFNTIIRWISPVIDAVTLFGLDVEIGFLKAEIAMKPFLGDLKKLQVDSQAVYYLGEGVSWAAEHMARLVIATAWLVAELSSVATHGGVQGKAFGTSFVDGIVLSMQAGLGPVHGAGGDLAQSAVDGAKERADAHSPSRVTYALGGDLTKGLELGIHAGSPEVARAMGDAADWPEPAETGQAKGGRSITVESGAIQVAVHAPHAKATADEIREVTEDAMADVIERLVLELGG